MTVPEQIAAVLEGRRRYGIASGDCRDILPTLPAGSVQCCVTSPPYWGLRSYLPDDHPDKACELGAEPTPDEYVATMVGVFREVRRALRDDGTCWLNLGDCYAGSQQTGGTGAETITGGKRNQRDTMHKSAARFQPGLKPKDLVGIPWRVAFALQADGWWLRSDVIWAKSISGAYRGGSCMPESVMDRPTRAHEYLFLLTKSERYYYDQDAVREVPTGGSHGGNRCDPADVESKARITQTGGVLSSRLGYNQQNPAGRNLRSVWHHSPQAFPGSHFAVMPPALVLPCVLAGTSANGCCPECGAAWVRIVERVVERAPYQAAEGERQRNRCNGAIGGGTENVTLKSEISRTTTNWRSTCTCPPADPVPCTVLDPFTGAGTVGVVATQNGRKFIGCELSDDYAAMARKRIANPRSVEARPHEGDPRQVPLFGGES